MKTTRVLSLLLSLLLLLSLAVVSPSTPAEADDGDEHEHSGYVSMGNYDGTHKVVCSTCGAEWSEPCVDQDNDGICDLCYCMIPGKQHVHQFGYYYSLHDGTHHCACIVSGCSEETIEACFDHDGNGHCICGYDVGTTPTPTPAPPPPTPSPKPKEDPSPAWEQKGDPTTSPTPTAPRVQFSESEIDENGLVIGTGRVLVVTGCWASVTLWDKEGTVVLSVDWKEGILLKTERLGAELSETGNRLVITFPDDTPYSMEIIWQENLPDDAVIGLGLYHFDVNQQLTSITVLTDEPIRKRGTLKVEIDSEDGMTDPTGNAHFEQFTETEDPRAVRELGAFCVTYEIQTDGEVVSIVSSYYRYGEVTGVEAPEPPDGMSFDGWYLNGEGDALTKELAVYYYVTDDVRLVARYTRDPVSPIRTGGDRNLLLPLLLGFVGLGCIVAAGILLLQRKKEGGRAAAEQLWQPPYREPLGDPAQAGQTLAPPANSPNAQSGSTPPEPPTRIEVWDPRGL